MSKEPISEPTPEPIPEKYRGVGPRIDYAMAQMARGMKPDFVKDELILQGCDEDLAGKIVATVVEYRKMKKRRRIIIAVSILLLAAIGVFMAMVLLR